MSRKILSIIQVFVAMGSLVLAIDKVITSFVEKSDS